MFKTSIAATLLLAGGLSTLPAQDEKPKLESEIEKVSYLIGRNIGETIREDELGLNVDNLVAGLREALGGKEGQIADADAEKIMAAFGQKMQAAAAAKAEEQSKSNAEDGKKFLEENKKREGVKVTESGLQYEVLKEGKGAKPAASDRVSVHYHGTLLDGTVFDSSVDRGEPTTFGVGEVIPGWVEGLQLMPVGSKWKLFIPAALAYGERGAGGAIGPNSTLVFEVELLGIEGK